MFRTTFRYVPIVFAVLLAGAAQAAGVHRAKTLELSHYWVRNTIGAVPNTAGYVTIRTTDGKPDRLLRAASPAANKLELHTHLMENGIAKMRPVPSIAVPADKPAALKPGGFHIMFIGVKHPLKPGDKVQLTLTFERAGDVTLTVPVQKGPAMGGHMKMK